MEVLYCVTQHFVLLPVMFLTLTITVSHNNLGATNYVYAMFYHHWCHNSMYILLKVLFHAYPQCLLANIESPHSTIHLLVDCSCKFLLCFLYHPAMSRPTSDGQVTVLLLLWQDFRQLRGQRPSRKGARQTRHEKEPVKLEKFTCRYPDTFILKENRENHRVEAPWFHLGPLYVVNKVAHNKLYVSHPNI